MDKAQQFFCTCTSYARIQACASISFLALETRLQNETGVYLGEACIRAYTVNAYVIVQIPSLCIDFLEPKGLQISKLS